MPQSATLLPELALAAETGARWIAGVDEVGRGALAGPVTVGVAVLDLADPAIERETGVLAVLDGVRDSKLLTPKARQRWAPVIAEEAPTVSVQHSAPERIDTAGISSALQEAGLAGLRAVERRLGHPVDAVIVDGSHDWLTGGSSARVHAMVKADARALSVASASVAAKVERDALMERLAVEHPGYGWESNRGYGSAVHRAALVEHGATVAHRRSWNLGTDRLAAPRGA